MYPLVFYGPPSETNFAGGLINLHVVPLCDAADCSSIADNQVIKDEVCLWQKKSTWIKLKVQVFLGRSVVLPILLKAATILLTVESGVKYGSNGWRCWVRSASRLPQLRLQDQAILSS